MHLLTPIFNYLYLPMISLFIMNNICKFIIHSASVGNSCIAIGSETFRGRQSKQHLQFAIFTPLLPLLTFFWIFPFLKNVGHVEWNRIPLRWHFENRPFRSWDIKEGPYNPLPLIGVAKSLRLVGLRQTKWCLKFRFVRSWLTSGTCMYAPL